jgi:hypothetical protein
MKKRAVQVLLLFCFSFPLCAQQKSDTIDLKKIIVIENKKFKVYNNWISGGPGVAYNSAVPQLQFALGFDYNFHMRAKYFQFGLLMSGDAFRTYNNYQLHLGYGKRDENTFYNLAMFAGISYSSGYKKIGQLYSSEPYKAFGVYGSLQYIKKISYDVGIGPALFVDINTNHRIAGALLVLYFSGAYKGLAKK